MPPQKKRQATPTELKALRKLLRTHKKGAEWLATLWGLSRGSGAVSKRLNGDLVLRRPELERVWTELGVTGAAFQEMCNEIERQEALDGVGIPPPCTALDFAQVRDQLHAILEAKQSGAHPRAERMLLELQDQLAYRDALMFPWVDQMAGLLLNAKHADLAAIAFDRAADGYFRAWLVCRFEQARSYAVAASRSPNDRQAADWRQKALETFQSVIPTQEGDPKLRGDVFKTYAELLERNPTPTDNDQYRLRLYDAARLGYRLAVDHPRYQDPQMRANNLFNCGYCLWRLGQYWPAIGDYVSSLSISAFIDSEEPGVAYAMKYIARAHFALSQIGGDQRATTPRRTAHYRIAVWCSTVSVRMYEEIHRLRIGYGSDVSESSSHIDSRRIRNEIYAVNSIVANKVAVGIPRPKEVTRIWAVDTYRELLRPLEDLPEDLKPIIVP